MSKISARLVLPVAFVLCAVMVALAADTPRIEILSPKDNSTVQGGAVMIKFKTDHFKVISLKNENVAPAAGPAMNENAPMSASQSNPGMGPGGPATTTSANHPATKGTGPTPQPETTGIPPNQQSESHAHPNATKAPNAPQGHATVSWCASHG